MKTLINYLSGRKIFYDSPHVISWEKKIHSLFNLGINFTDNFSPLIKYSTEDTESTLGFDRIYSVTTLPLYSTYDSGDITIIWDKNMYTEFNANNLILILESILKPAQINISKLEINRPLVEIICKSQKEKIFYFGDIVNICPLIQGLN